MSLNLMDFYGPSGKCNTYLWMVPRRDGCTENEELSWKVLNWHENSKNNFCFGDHGINKIFLSL